MFDMEPIPTDCGQIVVGVAPQAEPCYMLQWAAEETLRRRTSLRMVHAYEPVPAHTLTAAPSPVMVEVPYGARRAANVELSRLVGWLGTRYPMLDVSGLAQAGAAVPVLAMQGACAALVVVGRRERGRIAEALLGSTALDVLDMVGCPVVAVPDRIGPVPAGAPVVLGVKARRTSTAAALFALGAAARAGVPLRVVHCWLPGEGSDEHTQVPSEAVAGLRDRFPDVPVHLFAVEGGAADLLVRESRSASLLVLGPGSSGRLPRRLGGVGVGVLRGTACPVAFAPTALARAARSREGVHNGG